MWKELMRKHHPDKHNGDKQGGSIKMAPHENHQAQEATANRR
jgi:hypothetical protein